MRTLKKWLFTKYDVFNRPVMTGMYQHTSTLSQSEMQALVDSDSDYFKSPGNPYHGYSNEAFPDITTPGCEVYTVTYYDNYEYVELPGFNGQYGFRPGEIAFMYPQATNVKGQITTTKTKILPNSEITPPFSNSYLISAIYYDEYLRAFQTVSDNHRGGLDIVSHRINYTGDVLLTKENHTATGAPVIVQHEFSYDNGKRLTKTKHKINEQYQLTLCEQKYKETGRLKRKYLQKTTTAMQTLDYRYNIRGWLTDINDVAGLGNDKFAMKLNYTNASHAQYNGNIASMQWNTARFGPHTYQFVYDKANRLKNGYTTNYNTSYSYYDNGNLKTLTRQGRFGSGTTYGMIDELTYDYSGNKLLAVNDVDEQNHQYNGFSDNYSFATNEFTYDANGNMVSDQNKDLDMIEYNFLNLPQQINFSEGYQEINYLYTANGQKLMKQAQTENGREQTVDYIGSFVYENDQVRYILTEEGRALAKSNGTFEYQYFLKDHLGNTRITFNQNGQIIQEDAYYPFGMQMNGLCYQSGVDYENKYLYNGKELQDEFGLDWYDYGARMYDAVIGRWHSVDPLASERSWVSPYNFCQNNPILRVDPNGAFDTWYTDKQGNVLMQTNDGSNDVVSVPDANVEDFEYYAQSYEDNPGMKDIYEGKGWNDHWKSEFGNGETQLSEKQIMHLGMLNSDWSRENAVEYWLNPTISNGLAASGSEALSQWTNPSLVVGGLSAGIGGFSAKIKIYRTYGGEAKPNGFSWTPISPNEVGNFRNSAGLPNANTGRFMIEGKVDLNSVLKTRAALPLDGNKGGLLEYIIDPKNVNINRVFGVNPEF